VSFGSCLINSYQLKLLNTFLYFELVSHSIKIFRVICLEKYQKDAFRSPFLDRNCRRLYLSMITLQSVIFFFYIKKMFFLDFMLINY